MHLLQDCLTLWLILVACFLNFLKGQAYFHEKKSINLNANYGEMSYNLENYNLSFMGEIL